MEAAPQQPNVSTPPEPIQPSEHLPERKRSPRIKYKKILGLFTPALLLLLVIGILAATRFPREKEPEIRHTYNPPNQVALVSPSPTLAPEELPITPGDPVYTNIPDTNQTYCFDSNSVIDCGSSNSGQDAQYQINQPRYTNNGDGTITDNVTGLMWAAQHMDKQSYQQGSASAETFSLAGHSDWRVPSIKELYSLMDFSGVDPPGESTDSSNLQPFIDTSVFSFEYGDTSQGDRVIDSQWITSSIYVSKVMNNQECFFGVNFADGRIKCYPTQNSRNSGYFLRLVRGQVYGLNRFQDNNDSTVTDLNTGLMWQKNDSGNAMSWEAALAYCENLSLANQTDWRLPNAKELQYIVDYNRSPDTTNSPAIDPTFQTSSITNEAGQQDYPYFWTSTTHISSQKAGANAVYISFGRALGNMNDQWIDVHGAGAQRSDPKSGNIADFPIAFGPQGDARRLHNFSRCVRGGNVIVTQGDPSASFSNTTSTTSPDTLPPTQPESAPNANSQPPQEAQSACSGKNQGDSCSFSTPNGMISGSCRQTPDGVMACVPG